MKFNRKTLVLAVVAVLAIGTGTTFAQDGEDGSSPRVRFQKDDRLITQFLKNPEDAPLQLREDISTLRQSQTAIRTAWIEGFRPGDNATADEIKAAREAFQMEFSEEIRASKQLRTALLRELRVELRDAVNDSTWNEQARAIYSEYQSIQGELGESWKSVRSELGRDATREEIRAAKERFNEANADLLTQQKELAKQVRDLIRENRDVRVADREGLPPELLDLRQDMNAMRDQMRTRQRQARDDMRDLNRSEREQYRRTLLEELKELHDEIKQRRRQVIDEIRGGQSGDRRPEG